MDNPIVWRPTARRTATKSGNGSLTKCPESARAAAHGTRTCQSSVALFQRPGSMESSRISSVWRPSPQPGNSHGPVEVAALLMNDVLFVLPEPETFLSGHGPVDRAQHGPVVRLCPRAGAPAQPRRSGRLSLSTGQRRRGGHRRRDRAQHLALPIHDRSRRHLRRIGRLAHAASLVPLVGRRFGDHHLLHLVSGSARRDDQQLVRHLLQHGPAGSSGSLRRSLASRWSTLRPPCWRPSSPATTSSAGARR